VPISSQFFVYLTPGSKTERVGEIVNDENGVPMLKVYVIPKPENNKANEALIKVLSEYLGVTKANISIKRGHKSRKKLVMITGTTIMTNNLCC
jgi:uncharacterized protein YggU (UPF0235/DUF167 family)